MQKNGQTSKHAIALTVLSALGRLVPHAPNVTPLGGACLFAGSRISGLLAYLLPLAVMIATDPFVGGFTAISPVIYASFLISVWIGRRLLGQVSPVRVGGAAFLCSFQFFVITNFAIWASAALHHSAIYSADFAGLVRCYSAALPFWGRTLAGDLLFSAGIFGAYEMLQDRVVVGSATAA